MWQRVYAQVFERNHARRATSRERDKREAESQERKGGERREKSPAVRERGGRCKTPVQEVCAVGPRPNQEDATK